MDQICPYCSHSSCEEQPRFCSACGGRMDGSSGSRADNAAAGDPQGELKNQQVAVFCSSLIPGLGQLYNGENLKGLAFLIGTLIGLFLLIVPGLVVWVYSMYDAHSISGKMNNRILPFRPMKPVYMISFIIISIFVVVVFIIAISLFIISSMLAHLNPAGNADFFRMLDASGRFF